MSLLYYGLSLNVGNLGGDIYLNFAFSAVVEAVAYTIAIPCIVFMGRKKFHCTCMIIGGVTLLLTILPELYGDKCKFTNVMFLFAWCLFFLHFCLLYF